MHKLEKTYAIDASPARVWKALTDPKLIKKYFFGTEAISDWKEGSAIIFKGIWEGKPYTDKGVILEFIPEKRFTFNYLSDLSGKEDKPENYARYTYELSGNEHATRLTIIQEDKFDSPEKRSQAWEHWDTVIEGLRKVV